MQEGILSLMQLPKTVCAVEELHDARLPMLTVMAHPTTAGVLASFASLGDVTIAEPGALIAFTGPRVVQQTTREKLPEDFGLAEQNLRFGHLDAIVPRPEQREHLVAAAAALRCVTRERARAGAQPAPAALGALAAAAAARRAGRRRGASGSSASSSGCRPTRATRRSGARSSSPATRTGRTRWTTSSASSTTGSSCTATAAAPTTARSSPASASSTAARSRSSATRRAATSRSGSTGSSGWPTPRATTRRCA